MIKKLIQEVFDSIRDKNAENSRNAIPHSDSLQKQMLSSAGIEAVMFNKIINILKESHKILSIEITKEDKERDVAKTDGYIEADLNTVRRLKNFFQEALVEMYEEEYQTRVLVHQLIKQLFPRMNSIANTPLGQIANKAIMLGEYEKLLQNRYTEYTEEWKEKKLNQIFDEVGESLENEINKQKQKEDKTKENQKKEEEEDKRRAVDTDRYEEFNIATTKYSLNKILQIFGVDFFFRVNLRKYNFEYINSAIESHVIDKKPDLLSLKNMLKKMRQNVGKDTQLIEHLDQIYKLERTVSRYLHYTSS